MFIKTRSLKQHLAGHNVPRHIIGKVLEELHQLSAKDTLEVFEMLGEFKARLKTIASDKSLTNQQRLIVERSYYVLKGDKTTLAKQLVKDFEAINEDNADTWVDVWSTVVKGARDFGKADRLSIKDVDPIYVSLWNKYNGTEAASNFEDKQLRINYVVSKAQKRLSTELRQWQCLPTGLRLSPVWDKVFAGIHLNLLEGAGGDCNNLVGNIDTTQEPGMKLRLFASPYLMFQTALDPLKRRLQQITAQIPQDCHQDQDSGAEWTRRQLMNNHRVYSYDLSSATHRFPWGLQLRLLQYLGVPAALLDLYAFVSKGDYRLHDGTSISWKSGQPLGTAPSFFAFSLAHHALVRGICADLNTTVDCYRMVGDDIVISNDKVAKRYEALMNHIGSQINKTKSIISKEVAEFAGYHITATELFRTGKLREVTRSNWLTYAKGWANRDVLTRDANGIVSSLEEFNAFTPFAESVMDPCIHRYIELQQANKACENLSIPEVVQVHDFATTVASYIPQRKDSNPQWFYDFYRAKMRKLGQEIVSYLPTSEWMTNTASPSFRINYGVRELLLELSECPTQCMPIWAEPLMRQRGGNPTFMRVRRALIQLATAYRLETPAAWLVDGSKFAVKIHKWHKAAKKLDAAGELISTLSRLEEAEYMQRKDRLARGTTGISEMNNQTEPEVDQDMATLNATFALNF